MKKGLIFLLIGLLLGITLGLLCIDILHIPIDVSKKYGVLETVYYISSPIGTFITFLAVLVAVFGNEFKMWLFREKCDVYIDKDTFAEVVSGSDNIESIEARQYDCNLCIENIGGREIEECGLFLKSVVYRIDNSSKPKNLRVLNQKALYWNRPDITRTNILTNEKKIVPILRIHPSVTTQTPDNLQSSIIPVHISIMGYSLDEKYNRKGIWEIAYCISTPHKVIKEFTVRVSWSGAWKQRQTEMTDEVTVELIKS